MASKIIKRLMCPQHPDQEIGAVIESVVYDGVHDNGEDYSVERNVEYVPCPKCEVIDAIEESRCPTCGRSYGAPIGA